MSKFALTDNMDRVETRSPMVDRILILNRLRWYARLPIKWVLLGLVILIVCYPDPNRLVRHLRHWTDPNQLVEPDAAALKPMIQELRAELPDDLAPRVALQHIERFVYRKIPYAWDWETWGVVDYLPTVAEVIEQGREDCDGRAVVAASLLRNFGFEAYLVNDLAHMWVRTDAGDTMSPGKQAIAVATEDGFEIQIPGFVDSLQALAFGVAVFPVGREFIILLALWMLLLRANTGVARSLIALALLAAGLMLTRYASRDLQDPQAGLQMVGAGALATAMLIQLLGARHGAGVSTDPASGDSSRRRQPG